MPRTPHRDLRGRRENAALGRVPPVPCDAALLRAVTANELASAFTDQETTAAWFEVEGELARVCPIEDGRTGGVNPGDRRALWYLVRHFGFGSVLEVGTHVGASTLYLAAALRANAQLHSGLQPSLVTLDVRDVNSPTDGYWKEYGLSVSPAQMIAASGCAGFVRFVTVPSLAYLASCDRQFDLVFLDGDHEANTVYQELVGALAILNDQGAVLLHDYFPGGRPLWRDALPIPGPYLATARIRQEGAAIAVRPLGELPWPTKQRSRRTSLALVSRRRNPVAR